MLVYGDGSVTGSFYRDASSLKNGLWSDGKSIGSSFIQISPSRQNKIFGKSAYVQPSSTRALSICRT